MDNLPNMSMVEWIHDEMEITEYNLGDVHTLAMGNCNLKRAKGYIGHFSNWLECFVNPQYPTVYVFTEIPSRFMDTEKITDAKDVRHLVIDFKDKELAKLTTDDERQQYKQDTLRAMTELAFLHKGRQYHCSCKAGARTTNPCAHITAVLVFIFLCKWGDLGGYMDKIKPTHYEDPMDCIQYKRWVERDNSSNSAQRGGRGRGARGRRGNRRSGAGRRGGGNRRGRGRGSRSGRARGGYGPVRGQENNVQNMRSGPVQRARVSNVRQLPHVNNMCSNRNVHRGRNGNPNDGGCAGIPPLEASSRHNLSINFNN